LHFSIFWTAIIALHVKAEYSEVMKIALKLPLSLPSTAKLAVRP